VREFREDQFLIFVSRNGVVKKTALDSYKNVRVVGVNAINIGEDDRLIDVQITGGQDEIILATRKGMAIRFRESDVREMGRATTGVRGIRLRGEDHVVGMVVVRHAVAVESTLLVVTERGRGKRSAIEDYRLQGRGGQGVINFRLSDQTGNVVAIKSVQPDDELMLITRHGVVNRQRVGEIRVIGRATQGVRVLMLDEGDVLMDVARVVPEDEVDEIEQTNGATPPEGLPHAEFEDGEDPLADGLEDESDEPFDDDFADDADSDLDDVGDDEVDR
jgi:DNA gyrase subunit A